MERSLEVMPESCRILIVEDDESIRNLTRMHLRMNGFANVFVAPDGEEGLELERKLHPDAL